MKEAYKLIAKSKRKSHQRNENLYDCRAKGRTKSSKETAKRSTKYLDQDEENEFQFRRFPLEITGDLKDPLIPLLQNAQIQNTPLRPHPSRDANYRLRVQNRRSLVLEPELCHKNMQIRNRHKQLALILVDS